MALSAIRRRPSCSNPPNPSARGRSTTLTLMLDRYYDLRGWSREGVPTVETLRRLGLEAYLNAD